MKRMCRVCLLEYDLINFPKHSKSKEGHENRCKSCKKKYDFERYLKNPEYHRIKSDEWTLLNPEKKKLSLEKHKNSPKYRKTWDSYYEKNKEKLKRVAREWNYNNKDRINVRDNIKYKNDPIFKLSKILRSRLTLSLKGKLKYEKTFGLLGCDINTCVNHLENKFLPEFVWGNLGLIWEIDHIIPCSSFDLSKIEDQQKCFHYTNLQPLFKTTEIAESFGYNDQIGNRNKSNKMNE